MTDLSRHSLVHLLLDHPAAGWEPLVCTIEAEVTKDAFTADTERLAGILQGIGAGPGRAVAVQQPTGPGMAVGMFATWLAGAVFVPVNSRQTEREVQHILSTIRPAAFIGPGPEQLGPAAAEPAGYGPDVAFVTWTSGTTGRPKPILQTHSGYREILGRVLGSIRSGSLESGSGSGPSGASRSGSSPSGSSRSGSGPSVPPGRGRHKPDDRRPSPNLVPVSLALNAGIYNLLFGFTAGAPVVLMERFEPVEFATLVGRYGIRSTVLPPAAMIALSATPEITDLRPLRYVRSITAPLSPLAARRFTERFGVTVLNGYGQAEIGEVIGWTAADARDHPEKIGAVGRPHPGVEVRVVDDEGRPVPAGVVGHLLVKPPRMAAGYAGGEDLSDRIDPAGFVRTGDLASIEGDGFVWIEGRESDLINRGGNKIFPDQVEEVLELLPGVTEAAVVGVPDDRLGQVPVAFVVGDATDEELVAVCRENLVPYKIPVAFRHVSELPRTEVGKVVRSRLAGSWGERQEREGSSR